MMRSTPSRGFNASSIPFIDQITPSQTTKTRPSYKTTPTISYRKTTQINGLSSRPTRPPSASTTNQRRAPSHCDSLEFVYMTTDSSVYGGVLYLAETRHGRRPVFTMEPQHTGLSLHLYYTVVCHQGEEYGVWALGRDIGRADEVLIYTLDCTEHPADLRTATWYTAGSTRYPTTHEIGTQPLPFRLLCHQHEDITV